MLSSTRKRFLWSMLALILVVGQTAALTAADLVTIFVADTEDDSIGDAAAIDLYRMHREAKKIALYTDLEHKEVYLHEYEATPEKLLEALEALDLQADDVVIFYFSGHGYRTEEKGDSPWPNLFFSRVRQGVEYELIEEKLAGYQPRLTLLIADACNSLIPDEWAPPLQRKMFGWTSDEEQLKENYRRLFLETSGVVMVTSSEAGELSWATGYGSLYTGAFLDCLSRAVKSTEPAEWQIILDDAAIKVSGEQHPYYKIEIEAESELADLNAG